MSCHCDILNTSLLEYDKIDFGDGVLFNGQNIEMQRSYKCDRAQYFNGSGELTNHTINATLTVTDFRVQVFQFLNNASNGTFDEGKLILTFSLSVMCSLYSSLLTYCSSQL